MIARLGHAGALGAVLAAVPCTAAPDAKGKHADAIIRERLGSHFQYHTPSESDEIANVSLTSATVTSAQDRGFFSDEPITMETFDVRPLDNFARLSKSISEEGDKVRAKDFSWSSGGVITELKAGRITMDLRFKFSAEQKGIQLFNLSW